MGGGGKTTLLFRMAKGLSGRRQRVLLTTTTKMYVPGHSRDWVLIIEDDEDKAFEKVSNTDAGIVILGREVLPEGKMTGIDPCLADRIFKRRIFDFVLVEADGAKRKPIKAPAAHEPRVPESTTCVLGVIGLDAMGKLLTEEVFHRARLFSREFGFEPGAAIDEDIVAALVTSRNGLFKNAPDWARKILVLNKADDQEARLKARKIAFAVKQRKRCDVLPDIILMSSFISDKPYLEVLG